MTIENRPVKRVCDDEVQYSEPIDSKGSLSASLSITTNTAISPPNNPGLIIAMQSQGGIYSEPIDCKRKQQTSFTTNATISPDNPGLIVSMQSQGGIYSEPIDCKRKMQTSITTNATISPRYNTGLIMPMQSQGTYSEPFKPLLSEPVPPPIPIRSHLPDVVTRHKDVSFLLILYYSTL